MGFMSVLDSSDCICSIVGEVLGRMTQAFYAVLVVCLVLMILLGDRR